MYTAVKPLNKSDNLQFNPNIGYGFAARENFCPVFLQELPRVIREYYVCFPDNGTDLPHALLGFKQGVNRYVDEDGTWRSAYIPIYIRRYPFILARSDTTSSSSGFTLAIDADAPHFNSGPGKAIFNRSGEPTDFLKQRIRLLQAIESQRVITQQAVRQIGEAGLFQMQEMGVMAGDKQVGAIDGLRMIDEQKLAAAGLGPGDAMELVYGHLFSKMSLRDSVLADMHYKAIEPKPESVASISFDGEFIRFQ